LYTILVIFVALRCLDRLLIRGRGARAHCTFIGNRTSRRSFTLCLFSRWPRAVFISLRSRRIARSGGIRASARSLLSRAGKTRTPPRELHCSCRGAHTSTRFFGRYFLWDSIVSLVHYEGMGFVIHGARLILFGSYPDKTDGNLCARRVGMLDYLFQWLCEVSFASLFHSAILSISLARHRGPSLLIMAHVSCFGNCTWLFPRVLCV
jgi:hypothetical protein